MIGNINRLYSILQNSVKVDLIVLHQPSICNVTLSDYSTLKICRILLVMVTKGTYIF